MTEVKVIAEYLQAGKTVKYEPLGTAGPDLLVDGVYIEIKSIKDPLIKTSSNHITPIENNIDKANVQLGKVTDGGQKKLVISINGGLDSSLTKDDVKTHITNYLGKKIFPKGHNIQNIEIIWLDGTKSTGKLINDVMEWSS